MTCKCKWCVRGRELRAINKRGDVAEMRKTIVQLFDDLGNTSEDLNYKTAILDGSWHSAREILTRAIAAIDAVAVNNSQTDSVSRAIDATQPDDTGTADDYLSDGFVNEAQRHLDAPPDTSDDGRCPERGK